MSQPGLRLIQAAQEAAAMARGEAVPGGVIHPAQVQTAEPEARPGPAAALPDPVSVRDADGGPT